MSTCHTIDFYSHCVLTYLNVSLIFAPFQGFSHLAMTPFKAGQVLAQAAHHLGWEGIPDQYLAEEKLGGILLPEDYVPLKNVSTNLTTT